MAEFAIPVSLDKSGPAFGPRSLPAHQWGHALQAQGLRAAGEVLDAIQRRVMLDVAPAWSRLLAVASVKLDATATESVLLHESEELFWAGLRHAVIHALGMADTISAPIAWRTADAVMREAARQRADRLETFTPSMFLEDRKARTAQALTLRAFANIRPLPSGRVCDCGARNTRGDWPVCRSCDRPVCQACSHPGTFADATDTLPARVTCKACVTTSGPCRETADELHPCQPGNVCPACGYSVAEDDPRDPDYERADVAFGEDGNGGL